VVADTDTCLGRIVAVCLACCFEARPISATVPPQNPPKNPPPTTGYSAHNPSKAPPPLFGPAWKRGATHTAMWMTLLSSSHSPSSSPSLLVFLFVYFYFFFLFFLVVRLFRQRFSKPCVWPGKIREMENSWKLRSAPAYVNRNLTLAREGKRKLKARLTGQQVGKHKNRESVWGWSIKIIIDAVGLQSFSTASHFAFRRKSLCLHVWAQQMGVKKGLRGH